MVATFVSALVACMKKELLLCTGWPFSGVMRTPMLVGTTIDHAQFFLTSGFTICWFLRLYKLQLCSDLNDIYIV
jgi:hypothetical protein